MQETKVIKILVVGDSAVGKTSLINRYNSNLFDLNINSTIGVDFAIKNFQKNNTRYRIQFWDVAGKIMNFIFSKLLKSNLFMRFNIFFLITVLSLKFKNKYFPLSGLFLPYFYNFVLNAFYYCNFLLY